MKVIKVITYSRINPVTREKKPGYYVLSESKRYSKKRGRWTRRNLGGPYTSRKQAEVRLRQVEAFKHLR